MVETQREPEADLPDLSFSLLATFAPTVDLEQLSFCDGYRLLSGPRWVCLLCHRVAECYLAKTVEVLLQTHGW